MTVDELMRRYASELETIYSQQTAGKHTFLGVLSDYTVNLVNIIKEKPNG